VTTESVTSWWEKRGFLGQVYAMRDGKNLVEKDRALSQDVNLANRMPFLVSQPGNEALVKHEQGCSTKEEREQIYY
jgi:hypothetical protein